MSQECFLMANDSERIPGKESAMLLYAGTIFVSAFLLFQVQFIIAKVILPWFGGSAAVWTLCILFFQVVLLLGYLYAHWSIRILPPKKQVLFHVILLGLSLLTLPIIPGSRWKPTGPEDPTARILALLAVSVGLPYFLLSTTSPLLQAWYSRTFKGSVPYRLFALSNAGSMLALLSYPVIVEPLLAVRWQALGWSLFYLVFTALCGAVALRSRDGGEVCAETADGEPGPGWGLRFLWTVLPACASALFMSVTNHLTQNVAAIPFLWVLPLTLYLLSFILCFSGERRYWRKFYLLLIVPGIAAMSWLLLMGQENASFKIMMPVFAGGLFVCCMVCHGELARLAPHPRHLTSYYLMISLGGAVGGLFVGLFAPNLFSGYFELPVSLAACAILVGAAVFHDLSKRPTRALRHRAWLAVFPPFSVALAVFVFLLINHSGHGSRLMVRNFYGSLCVSDRQGEMGLGPVRTLLHGTIIHGTQFLRQDLRRRPTTYFGTDSGVGLALLHGDQGTSLRVGIIGLGAGTLACYGRPGDSYRFYEINPLVISLARSEFTFLGDSGARIDVVPGDGRLSLEREPEQVFDIFVVDAFSGDSIPVHLITREAFTLYFRHLKENGILAVHITNKYIDLKPVVRRLAEGLGKEARLVETNKNKYAGTDESSWVLITGNRRFLEEPAVKAAGKPIPVAGDRYAWTDDYSNLLRVLK
jgi:SAM-dependent methyltransferase